jgi:chromosome segregation ATPase
MKINKNHLRWAIPGTLALATVFALLSWTGGPDQTQTANHNDRDTVPAKQRNRITREPGDKDLDKELRQLDAAKESLKEVDWEQIQQTVESALKNVDMEKIQQQVEQAMKQVNMEKIQQEVAESMKKIDYNKIQQEVNEAIRNADTKVNKEEIRKEIEKAMREVKKELKNEDWKQEMEEVRKVNMKEVQQELEKAREEMKKAKGHWDKEKLNFKGEMEKAHVEIEKAKVELKGYQQMIYDMEKDGLLSTKEDYTIEWKKGDLFINDKKQSAETAGKYSKYFKKDTITITKEDGDVEIKHHEKHHD